jgi:NAD(P)-dependent dehydrogenase (short-subunit alcohol dehydrogenase family)
LEFIECDQTSLASVHTAAKKFLALSDRLDIFIANAGIMGGQPGVSKDGYEIQFAINYLSHALFTKLFMPLAEQTATSGNGDVRIIYLASVGFRYTPSGGIVFKDLRSPQTNLGIGIMAAKWYRYGQAKLAMVLQAIDIAGRHPLVTTAALHPGTIHTGLITDQPTLDRWFLKFATLGKQIRPDQGAWNTCWAATVPLKGKPELVSGGIYEPVGVPLKGTSDSSSVKLREELRDWTDKALDQYS